MRDERRNYLVVGSFVLAMLVALILWIALLSGRAGTAHLYEVRYRNVMGIAEGTEVRLQGYPVGLVERIAMGSDGHFSVWVRIGRGWEIPEDSAARIASSGVLSAAVIDIERGSSTEMIEPGSRIPGMESASLMTVLSNVAGEIGDLANDGLAPLLESVGERVPGILDEMEAFTQEIRQTAERLNTLLDDDNRYRIEGILVNMEDVSADVASLTEDLGRTRERVDAILAAVDDSLERSAPDLEASLADLRRSLAAVARHADSIAFDVESASRNLNEFSEQVRRDPSVLLRGREDGEEPEVQ